MNPKSLLTMVSIAGLLATPSAFAQSATPSTSTAQQAACPRAQQMHQHMQRMQTLKGQMAKATSDAQRERIRTEQREAMREGMEMMRGPGMGPRGGQGRSGQSGMGQGAGMGMGPCAGERMSMMEMMMEMMLDHTEPPRRN